jgi:SPP1 family predicted phage head-tail adaptor
LLNPVSAGVLNRRITIQERLSAQDSFGAQSTAWTDVVTLWAWIDALSGGELLRAQSIATQVSHQITLRYQPLFANPKTVAAYRAIYRGRIFNIHASMNLDESDSRVVLLASEGLNNG